MRTTKGTLDSEIAGKVLRDVSCTTEFTGSVELCGYEVAQKIDEKLSQCLGFIVECAIGTKGETVSFDYARNNGDGTITKYRISVK